MKKLFFVVLVLLISTVGCISIPGGCAAPLGGPSGANRPPIAYIDSITPSSAAPGEKITFVGHGTDVDGTVVAYRWRSSISGDLSSMATFDAKLDSGEHIIYLKVQDNNGAWSDEVRSSVMISGSGTPSPAGLPVINSFSATPASITLGSSSMLSWDVSNATSVSIDQGIGPVGVVGNTSVSPGISTNYMLTATNSAGSMTATTQVVVSGAAGMPVINSFSVTPASITLGSSSVLNWNVSNATSVSIDPGVGVAGVVGNTSVSPGVDTNYTLTASNSVGWVSQTILVTVIPPLVIIKTAGPLPNLSSEFGGISKQGATYTKYGGACAGDTTTDGTRRGFLSFDISSIPAGSTIVEAILDFSNYTKDGNPTYATLGFFEVYHYQYGTLDDLAADFNASGKLVKGGRFSSYPLSPWKLNAKESSTGEQIIQGLVDAHRPRSQFKVQFSNLTDGDHVLDFLCFNNATLTIKYTTP